MRCVYETAAKIMWVLYERPDADFESMAMDFMDIRKRIYKFPKMGEKAMMVAIPTSSGTGSEVTPFAIITDEKTGTKWPLADYELLPNMAIVDVDNMMSQPKGLTSASGIDVMTHAVEAYVSIMATQFTDGLALKAIKAVFDYLPSAYENGANDPIAREKMAEASCMAGMASVSYTHLDVYKRQQNRCWNCCSRVQGLSLERRWQNA